MGTAAAMSELTTLKERVTRDWRHQQRQYAHGEDFPLGGYATAMSVYGGVVATIGAAVRLTGTRLPDGISPWDTAMTAVATHKRTPPADYRPRRSVALATLATIAANGGMTRATADMMTAASTEYRSTTAHETTNSVMQTPIRTK